MGLRQDNKTPDNETPDSRSPDDSPGRRRRRREPIWAERHPWLSALGLIALAIAVLASIWDWNWFRGIV